MKTLEQIKDDYAETQHYGCWNELLLNNCTFTVGNLHLNKVMKIYAMECLKLASENADLYDIDDATYIGRQYYSDDVTIIVNKESITNENNIIK